MPETKKLAGTLILKSKGNGLSEGCVCSREDIIARAKQLYLTPNDAGAHEHSLQAISFILREEYDHLLDAGKVDLGVHRGMKMKSPSKASLIRWKRTKGWDIIWKELEIKGKTKELTEIIRDDLESPESIEKLKKLIRTSQHFWFIRNHNIRGMAYELMKEILEKAMPLTEKEISDGKKGIKVRKRLKLSPGQVSRFYEISMAQLGPEMERAQEYLQQHITNVEGTPDKNELSEVSTEDLKTKFATMVREAKIEGYLDYADETGGGNLVT